MDNKYLAEAMGLCWHEWSLEDAVGFICPKCQKVANWPDNKVFSSKADWTDLLLWAQDDSKHEWKFKEFRHYTWKLHLQELLAGNTTDDEWSRWLFTPANFGNVIEAFLRQLGGNE